MGLSQGGSFLTWGGLILTTVGVIWGAILLFLNEPMF
jgi:hypothetical protein